MARPVGACLGGGVALVHAVFFAPALLVWGHTVLIVPVFVGAIVYGLVEGTGRAWWLAPSAAVVFAGSLVDQYVRSRRRLRRAPASGRG